MVVKQGIGTLWRFRVLTESVYGSTSAKGGTLFRENIRFLVGCGSRILFWHDFWCGERLLRLEFPLLYSPSRHKDAWVADCVEPGSRVVV